MKKLYQIQLISGSLTLMSCIVFVFFSIELTKSLITLGIINALMGALGLFYISIFN